MIASGSKPSIQDFSDAIKDKNLKGGYSRAAIFRIIKSLREDFNAPIEFDSETKGYYYTDKTFRIPALFSSEEQINAARIIRNLIDAVKNTPLYDDAFQLFETLSTVAPVRNNLGIANKETNIIDDEISDIIFLGARQKSFSQDNWKTINKAIQDNHYISFLYTSLYDNAVEYKRTIEPWQLIFSNGCWFVWGKDLKDKKSKLYSLSNIKEIEIRKEVFIKPDNFDFRNTTPGTFGCYTSDEYDTYKIRLTSYASKLAKNQIWGIHQTITQNTDDSIILSFESNQYYPILNWVMSWGADAIPLEPKEFVQDWKNRVEETFRVSKELSK